MTLKMQKPGVLLGICFLFFCPGLLFGQKASPKPNIIIILADDMGYGDISHLNPQSKVKTPNLDLLARKGIVFSNTHAGASVCTPSRYGLLTGRFAFRNLSGGRGASGFGTPEIEPGRETVADILQRAGYTTACVGKWHLGLTWTTKSQDSKVVFDPETGYTNVDYSGKITNGPNTHGFNYSFIHPASLDMPPYLFLRNHEVVDREITLTSSLYPDRLPGTTYHWDKKHTKEYDTYWDKGIWWRRGETSKSFRIENCLDDIVSDGLSFIKQHENSGTQKPFFLYLPLTGPHTPWIASKEFQGKSSIGAYGDFLLNIDDVARRVVAQLKTLSIEDNTLIIFTSDNGAYWPQEEVELHKHNAGFGRRGQKGDVWEGGHRVPLIISWPAQIKKHYVNNHLTSLTDIYATLAELTGQHINPDNGEDSFSFLSSIYGSPKKAARTGMVHHSSNGMFAFQKNGWKFVDGLGSGGFTAPVRIAPAPGLPAGQLYHIKTDSLETDNLYFKKEGLANTLRNELNELIKNGRSN